MNELDALDPAPEQVKLASGAFVQLEGLRARQFFKLLRIITHGAIPLFEDMSVFKMDPNADPETFYTRLLSLMVMSIPDAEEETLEFVRSMCKPVGLIERRDLNKQDKERNTELWTQLYMELDNPELDDLITIIEAVVRRESADIQALGKRLTGMFKIAEKTGQLSPNRTSPVEISSEPSPASTTSSHPSTDGQTTSSTTSRSRSSASVSRRSKSAASTANGSGSNG